MILTKASEVFTELVFQVGGGGGGGGRGGINFRESLWDKIG